MELVYLWVEDYKNIHRQGFNFSPRFECKFYDEYDEDGKLKDNCKLEIIEKKEDEYIKDFFGENINVTAIVGKNGSGKTNILEIITLLLDSNTSLDVFLVYCIEKKLFIIDRNNINPNKSLSIFIDEKNYVISYFYNCLTNPFSRMKYSCDENDQSSELCNGIKPSIKYLNYPEEMFYQKYARLSIDIKKLEPEYYFDRIMIYYNDDFIYIDNLVNDGSDINIYRILGYILLKELRQYFDYTNMTNVAKEAENINSQEIDNFINKLRTYNVKYKTNYFEFIKYIKSFFHNNKIKFKNIMKEDEIINFIISSSYEELEDEFKDFFVEQDQFKSEYLNLDHLNNFLKNKKLLSFLINNNIFKIELVNSVKGNVKYSLLSSGEKTLLKILTDIIYSIQTLRKPKNYIMLFDEIELSLHPNWQKKLIFYIIKSIELIKEIKKKELPYLHILFTTHSPFMLSDIPTQNIIFLDTDKNGNSTANGLNEKKQTFGANIHTLLSDSFFMNDGLMGEFAKGKINEIIDFFNNKNSVYTNDKKKLKKVIASIGEPFLKDKLLRMYDERYPPTDEERIKALEEQIESIKNGQN